MAVPRLPSVPFLKPTGMERPDAISLWVWDSVVRAPMADQEKSSARYCGLDGDRAPRSPGQLQLSQPAEQLAGAVQTQLHVEGAVQVRIVDKALPADRGARLLKVNPHDNVRVLIGVMQRFESGCVLFGGVHVVDGAGTTDHQQAVIATVDDVGDGVAGLANASARSEMGSFSLSWAGVIITCSDWIWMLFRGISLHLLILSTVSSQGR